MAAIRPTEQIIAAIPILINWLRSAAKIYINQGWDPFFLYFFLVTCTETFYYEPKKLLRGGTRIIRQGKAQGNKRSTEADFDLIAVRELLLEGNY